MRWVQINEDGAGCAASFGFLKEKLVERFAGFSDRILRQNSIGIYSVLLTIQVPTRHSRTDARSTNMDAKDPFLQKKD